MEPVINDENDMATNQEREQTDKELTDGEGSVASPSQSRSSSVHPPNDLMDVFDGYSFKGRHSVIIEDEEGVSEEEEEEDQNVTGRSILAELDGAAVADTVVTIGHEEPSPESKTPEARHAALPPSTPPTKWSLLAAKLGLPPVDTNLKPASIADTTPRASEETTAPISRPPTTSVKAVAAAAAAASTGPDIHHKEQKRASAPKPHGPRPNLNRREKSGIHALDPDLSDANSEDEVRTECDEEDEEDWDFIEADGEERNKARGNNSFARGIVDRYRLAVFRKGSTPNRAGTGEAAGLSALDGPSTPSPTTKERRGRTGALLFRPTIKTFPRSESLLSTSTQSSLSRGKFFRISDRFSRSTISTMQSLHTARTTLGEPSLKSSSSTVTVDSYVPSRNAFTSDAWTSDADII